MNPLFENTKRKRNFALKNGETLFRVLIESIEPEQSFFQQFWRPATHPGQAIDRVLIACRHLGITNPIARELDCSEFNSLPKGTIRDRKLNVLYAPERAYFQTENSFIAPLGIIEDAQKGEFDYQLIREGFDLSKTDADIYEVEAVIERDKLFSTFIELIKRLPSIRTFWFKIAGDWEDWGRVEFWTNEALNTPQAIKRYLTTHQNDTLANGHIALTVYSNAGQTNLLIDTHKTIKVLTKSAVVQRKMAAALRSLGYKELQDLHSLEHGYHHWHYRPARSKSRTRLIAALKNDGFTLWKSELMESDD